MIFSSAIFLFAFLPVVYFLYQILPGIKAKNCFLAFASLVFISFGQLVYIPVFLFSVLVNYLSGLAMMKRPGGKQAVLTVSIILNLGVLVFFKYTDFLIANLNDAFSLSIKALGFPLPIGISFYTFQGLSYSIDVYRKPDCGTKSFTKLLLYISLFPQLIAGPIVKYSDIAQQIESRETTGERTAYGIHRFVLGLAKKLLIANAVGYIADRVFNGVLMADVRLAWLGAVAYSLQIYYDFSGYSDMAIGLGHMFGFTIKENFRFPYAASSMIEFWRRWHISLTSWFREYLYIPLGGNRMGRRRTVLNRVIVFFCTGLWHGANWTFVLWGLLHGALTSLEAVGWIPTQRWNRSVVGRFFCRCYVLLSVMLLFVLFRADSVSVAFSYITAMFSLTFLPEGSFYLGQLLNPAACVCIVVAILAAGGEPQFLSRRFSRKERLLTHGRMVIDLALLALCMMSVSRGGFNPFIYFQF